MGFTAAGHNRPTLPSPQGYWRCRKSPVPPLEEAPLRSPRSSTEHPRPAAVKVPPMYPYVELSPSPLQQPRPASDTEKQQDGQSSGARKHPFDCYVEPHRSLNKRTLAEEASMSATANAGTRPMFREGLTPGHKDAAGGECKADVEDGHGVHPLYKSGNQNSGQRKTAETTPVDQINGPMLQLGRYRLACQESAAFDQQKGQGFSEPTSEQPRLSNEAVQKQEFRSSGARTHPLNKRTLVEEASMPAAANAGTWPSFLERVTPGNKDATGRECKAHVEDGHGMHPLYKSGNQNGGQRKTAKTTPVDQINGPMLQSGPFMLAGQESATFDEQKGREFSERTPEQPQLSNATVHAFNGYLELCLSPSKQAPVVETLVPVAAKADISLMHSALSSGKEMASRHQLPFGGEPKTHVEDGHGLQPSGNIRNQISEQRKAVESAMEDRIDKSTRLPGQHMPACQENAAYNGQKKVEFSQTTPERTFSGLKRKLAASAPLIKKQKPPQWQWSCNICSVNTVSERHLEEHLAGRRHQLNVEALQSSRSDTAEPSTKAAPVWDRITAKNTESLRGDGKDNMAENSGSQQGGKPCAEPKSSTHRNDVNTGKKADWKRALYCQLCDVQCNSEKMLASHLGGRRHRERLEESD
ncbi:hypothetical protein BAE44_0008636 [Dichanthelium oligosanthes]|uniref:C2H2-type domain-containing protein n=1 Tax=Dichanthelium oligosanthes TaxID=888268 RepID=A0A1E5VZ42_9POAL|nr:hypothetical protein BAE44_0008636 [Dichanthelium oligosanthes]